jgi:Rhamnan synthesis protein F
MASRRDIGASVMKRSLVIKLIKRLYLLYQRVRYWFNVGRGAYLKGIAIDGNISSLSANICVFSLFAPRNRIQRSTLSLIRAIRKAGYSLVVVVNGSEVSKDSFEGELGQDDILISRPNLGRDFAAYQFAINLLLKTRLSVERLLLCNDSVFFLDKNDPQDLFGRLITAGDHWIGMTEHYGGKYHISSWCFQVSSEVLNSPAFTNFWRCYRAVDSRRYAIRKGEIRFSHVMLAAGFTPTVLFNAALLLKSVLKNTNMTQERLLQRFCTVVKRHGAAAADLASTLEVLFEGEQLNQTSNLGVLLLYEAGFPFLKKDIALKANWPVSVVILILQQYMSEFCAETASEIKLRGIRRGLSSWQRLLVDAGIA